MLKSETAARSMRNALRSAADDKIVRIVSMLDDAVDPVANQVILDPLRGRLAMLRPARPLRFNRLLFTPLDPVIVPARYWRPEQAVIPRTILTALSQSVRAGAGPWLGELERSFAGCSTEAVQAITLAGETLWPRAADLLAAAPLPTHWSETGLPQGYFRPLADAVASVLRRGPQLRQLQREGDVGALEADQAVIASLLADLHREPPDTCAMVMRLILARAPTAIVPMRRMIAHARDLRERAILQHAMVRASGYMLEDMEHGNTVAKPIATGTAAGVADHVRRIVALLADMQDEASQAGAPAGTAVRLQAIRGRLDAACRARVAEELEQGLLKPVGVARAPVEGEAQERLETCLREVRAIETAARPVGGGAVYDTLLRQAAEAVATAAGAGLFTPMREVRLIELLQGPEAALALYRARVQGAAG